MDQTNDEMIKNPKFEYKNKEKIIQSIDFLCTSIEANMIHQKQM